RLRAKFDVATLLINNNKMGIDNMYSRQDMLRKIVVTAVGAFILAGCSSKKDDFNPEEAEIIGEEVAELTLPPNVPPPIERDNATKMIVHLEVIEKEMKLSDGVTYSMWTFGG